MKLFSKKLALLLVFALLLSTCLFTLSACDDDDDDENGVEVLDSLNGKTPQEAYAELIARTNAATNVEIVADQRIDMTMSAQGQSFQQTTDQRVTSSMNGNNMFVKLENTSEGTTPTEQLMEVWYVNGVCYSHIKGTGLTEAKVKATIDLNQFAEEYGYADASDTFPEFDAALLQDLKFTKADGKYYVEFTVTGPQVEELVGEALEDSLGVDCEFGNLKYKIFFNEQGEVTGFENEVTFSFQMSSSGVLVTTNATAKTVATVKFGTVGAINPPADASSYTDVTGRI